MSTGHKAPSPSAMGLVDTGKLGDKPLLGKTASSYLWPMADKHTITCSYGMNLATDYVVFERKWPL